MVPSAKLVGQFPECDAVFCNNDDLAMGVLFECQRRGIPVPGEFGICGYNDLGVTAEAVPTVTSVTTPLREMGQRAGQILLDSDTSAGITRVDLSFSVSKRESTRKQ